MISFIDKNFYENIYLIVLSSDSAQHEMDSFTDKNFHGNMYLRDLSQVIQLSIECTFSLIKIFVKIFIL
jgi:hypothetical protein